VARAPAASAQSVNEAKLWAAEEFSSLTFPTAAIAFGSGPAWAAALEAALLLKEIARVPCEGTETREGATSAMTGLLPRHLALSLPTDDDPFILETERICTSTGATVLRMPGGTLADARLVPVTTFAPALALSIDLALRNNQDPDAPSWTETYYATARRSQTSASGESR
jgi:hypothetical protein